ncbi:MAG: ribosomal protein S18 acetylase RimI-like enzyme [Pseudohongiellaceae bacterium]|jgi:ribosomal protein S18 acetylase RimI-like enzyme
MDIRTIRWDEALPIRHEVLWPNKPLLFCKVDGDETAMHYGVYLNETLVSIASVYLEEDVARLRKFATLVKFQRHGIGSILIAHIVSELEQIGVETFWCNARTTAVGFYKKLGMKMQGAEFNKSGIPYFKMEARLQPPKKQST